jgi:hypothetical protein
MALSRMALGTARFEDPDGIDVATIVGVNLGLGEALVVMAGCTPGDGANPAAPVTMTWNGHALTVRTNTNGDNVGLSIWVLENAPAETGDIVATWGNPMFQLQLMASAADGVDASSFDVKAENHATSITHTTGATPATAVPDSILIGAIAEVNILPTGTIQAPFTAGQSVNNQSADWWMALREGWAVVSASAAYTLQATVASNVEFAAGVVVLKMAVDAPGGGGGNLTPGSMSSARSLKIGI